MSVKVSEQNHYQNNNGGNLKLKWLMYTSCETETQALKIIDSFYVTLVCSGVQLQPEHLR